MDVFCRHPTCSSALGSCNLGSLRFSSSLPSCPSPPPPAWPWPSLICCLSLCLHPRIHQNHPPTPPHLHLIRTKMDKMISSAALSMRTEILSMFLSQIKLALFLFARVFGIHLQPAFFESSEVVLPSTMFFRSFLPQSLYPTRLSLKNNPCLSSLQFLSFYKPKDSPRVEYINSELKSQISRLPNFLLSFVFVAATRKP